MHLSYTRRRLAAATAAISISALSATFLAAPSQADGPTPLAIVGTSDVSDSDLMSKVIKPGFEAAHPEYRLDYTGTGTGQAIGQAKTGVFSALIVHAASLENQFVADGFSNESYGRAIFWGDFVMTGPQADPATVKATDEHDIVGAYEKIAAAGQTGAARFVSRGGTPGTTVQEHAIWALTGDINGAAPGTGKCTVSPANGGGERPSTVGGNCVGEADAPAWYTTTGKKQAANILEGNACNFDSPQVDNCYVFTDRGTFNNLEDQNTVGNLKVVTRTNNDTARGGGDVLVNKFHAYVMNPNADYGSDNTSVNVVGGTALVDWITSPAGQKAIGNYLANDPPFIPAAAPKVTTSAVPKLVKSGTKVAFRGSIANVTPGTPALNNVTVRLQAIRQSNLAAPPVTVATAKTSANGSYSISYTPQANMIYSLSVPQITKIQDPTLDPPFGDLLTATSKQIGVVQVKSAPRITSVKRGSKSIRVKGKLSQKVYGSKGQVRMYGVPTKYAGKRTMKYLGKVSLRNGATSFNSSFKLSNRDWTIRVSEVNPGVLIEGQSNAKKVKKR